MLDAALAARAAVAVLPCCHGGALEARDTAGLEAWMEGSLAVDAVRALRLRAAGYRVHLQTIPQEITPQNRLLVGVPSAPAGAPPEMPHRSANPPPPQGALQARLTSMATATWGGRMEHGAPAADGSVGATPPAGAHRRSARH